MAASTRATLQRLRWLTLICERVGSCHPPWFNLPCGTAAPPTAAAACPGRGHACVESRLEQPRLLVVGVLAAVVCPSPRAPRPAGVRGERYGHVRQTHTGDVVAVGVGPWHEARIDRA